MGVRQALLTGAGISAGPPASLPLGRRLDDLLRRCCFEAAARVAPGQVDPDARAAVGALPRNLITRLAACAGSPTVTDLLRCFHVIVPNEAHLIAAVHAVRGSLHVTMNFDDGIETAYTLLSGAAELPTSVPDVFRSALEDWRRVVRPLAALRVVASGFTDVDLDHRPLLVKLRGSAEEGWDRTLLPSRRWPEVDPPWLSDEQLHVVRKAAAMRSLAIAGISGAHADCRTTLLPLLRRGEFSWTAAAIGADMVALVRRIDPSQPTLKPALEGLRSALPRAGDLPAWPRTAATTDGFERGFTRWRRRLPVDAAAETCAWLLSEAGLHDRAVTILRALSRLRVHDVPRAHTAE